MQLLSVMSTRRNFPPKGTAPLDRSLVKGCNLSPAPPAIIITKTRSTVLVVCSGRRSGRLLKPALGLLQGVRAALSRAEVCTGWQLLKIGGCYGFVDLARGGNSVTGFEPPRFGSIWIFPLVGRWPRNHLGNSPGPSGLGRGVLEAPVLRPSFDHSQGEQ